MNYYFSKTLNMSLDKAIAGVTEELKKEGFGILTDIDVKATLKKGLRNESVNGMILQFNTGSSFLKWKRKTISPTRDATGKFRECFKASASPLYQ